MCGTDYCQVNDLERRAHGMNGLRSVRFCGQLVMLTEILMSFRGCSEVVLRSFGSRKNWLNNDP